MVVVVIVIVVVVVVTEVGGHSSGVSIVPFYLEPCKVGYRAIPVVYSAAIPSESSGSF